MLRNHSGFARRGRSQATLVEDRSKTPGKEFQFPKALLHIAKKLINAVNCKRSVALCPETKSDTIVHSIYYNSLRSRGIRK